MLADAETEFISLALFAWDDKFHWGMSTDALAPRAWKRIIIVDGVDLGNYGTFDVKQAHHVAAMGKGLQSFECGSLVDYDDDVDMWRYRAYSEQPYVANLCSFIEEDLTPW